MQIELVYEKSCPNVDAARNQLAHALAATGLAPRWQEWEVSDPNAPAHIHGYGSPTVLVNGRDVAGGAADGHDYCCRVYAGGDTGNKGVPSLQAIRNALRAARSAE